MTSVWVVIRSFWGISSHPVNVFLFFSLKERDAHTCARFLNPWVWIWLVQSFRIPRELSKRTANSSPLTSSIFLPLFRPHNLLLSFSEFFSSFLFSHHALFLHPLLSPYILCPFLSPLSSYSIPASSSHLSFLILQMFHPLFSSPLLPSFHPLSLSSSIFFSIFISFPHSLPLLFCLPPFPSPLPSSQIFPPLLSLILSLPLFFDTPIPSSFVFFSVFPSFPFFLCFLSLYYPIPLMSCLLAVVLSFLFLSSLLIRYYTLCLCRLILKKW